MACADACPQLGARNHCAQRVVTRHAKGGRKFSQTALQHQQWGHDPGDLIGWFLLSSLMPKAHWGVAARSGWHQRWPEPYAKQEQERLLPGDGCPTAPVTGGWVEGHRILSTFRQKHHWHS